MFKPAMMEEIAPARSPRWAYLGATTLGVLLFATIVAIAAIGSSRTSPTSSIRSPDGGIVINATVRTSPSTTESGEVGGFSELEFHPSYFVAKRPDGSGRVYLVDRVEHFSWSLRSDRPSAH